MSTYGRAPAPTHPKNVASPGHSRWGRRLVDGSACLIGACFAFLQWTFVLDPPVRFWGWISLGAAALGPLLCLLVWNLGRRAGTGHPRIWQLCALSTSMLCLSMALALWLWPEGDCATPCAPFPAPIWNGVTADRMLAAQVGLGVLCGAVALGTLSSRVVIKVHRLLLGVLLLQGLAWLAFLDGAYLGWPGGRVVRTVEVEGEALRDMAGWAEEQGLTAPPDATWKTSLGFLMTPSFEPEAYYLIAHLDADHGGRIVSLRASAECSGGSRMQVVERELSTWRTRQLLRRLRRLDLQSIDPRGLGSVGLDGSIWALSGQLDGQPLALSAWTPNYNRPEVEAATTEARLRVAAAGRRLMAASGLAVCERRLY